MYDIERVKRYAWEQADGIAHSNGYYHLKDIVFFYHKGIIIFDPWYDRNGSPVADPYRLYGKDKVDEFCRRMIAKREGEAKAQEVSVDVKILDFLKMLYFGVTENPFEAASKRAYTDMCRTIRFNGKSGEAIRKMVDVLLEERIPDLVMIKDAKEFTFWHESICEEILALYAEEGIEFYIGQAQKWVNMTLKYLYVLVPDVVEPFYRFLHIPLDNYIMDIAKKQYGVPDLPCAWSRIPDYKTYLDYEERLIEVIDDIPLDWEFLKWVESARSAKLQRER